MKLKLVGHDYKYAVEQIMLMMFPGERPEYEEPEEGALSAVIAVSRGERFATASTQLVTADGGIYRGFSRVSEGELRGKLATDRLLQKMGKVVYSDGVSTYIMKVR